MLVTASTRRPATLADLLPPPLCAALDRLDLSSRRTFAGKLQGERRSKARGRSVEFEDYRPYVPGDDLRHVDWNVFARLDRFFIKIFLEEQDLALHIAIDASASMDSGSSAPAAATKLVQAQRIAMAMAYLGLVNNNRVVVWVFDEAGVRHLPPTRGRLGVQTAARFILEQVRPEPATGPIDRSAPAPAPQTFSTALRRMAQARAGKGVFVLLSDLLIPEGYQQGLSLLGDAAGWDTTVIQVLSPGEIDPASEVGGVAGERIVIGDLRLIDCESGRAAEVTVNAELLARYRERFERYQREVAGYLAARGMTHVVVRSDADVAALLLGDLRRRGLVR